MKSLGKKGEQFLHFEYQNYSSALFQFQWLNFYYPFTRNRYDTFRLSTLKTTFESMTLIQTLKQCGKGINCIYKQILLFPQHFLGLSAAEASYLVHIRIRIEVNNLEFPSSNQVMLSSNKQT